ncbi:MAG TPA: hypothetical protein VF800_14375 [Telluria sp.]
MNKGLSGFVDRIGKTGHHCPSKREAPCPPAGQTSAVLRRKMNLSMIGCLNTN